MSLFHGFEAPPLLAKRRHLQILLLPNSRRAVLEMGTYAFFLPPSGLGRENAVIPMGMKSALWNQKWAVTYPSSVSAAICSSAVSLGNLETERKRRVGMGKKRNRQSKNARNYFFPRWIVILHPKNNCSSETTLHM